jgi:hypothetical protein
MSQTTLFPDVQEPEKASLTVHNSMPAKPGVRFPSPPTDKKLPGTPQKGRMGGFRAWRREEFSTTGVSGHPLLPNSEAYEYLLDRRKATDCESVFTPF